MEKAIFGFTCICDNLIAMFDKNVLVAGWLFGITVLYLYLREICVICTHNGFYYIWHIPNHVQKENIDPKLNPVAHRMWYN